MKKAAGEAKAKADARDSDMENADDSAPEPVAVKQETSRSGDAGKDAESQEGDVKGHPEHGVPPHPDAEIAMIGSKAVWQYINDKGEEVTVVRCCCSCIAKCLLLYHPFRAADAWECVLGLRRNQPTLFVQTLLLAVFWNAWTMVLFVFHLCVLSATCCN